MAKYIDADRLIAEHIEAEKDRYGKRLVIGNNRFLKRFMEAPAADVEPVVRCKDCKYRRVAEYGPMKYECELDTGDPYCHGRQAWWPDWFCAEGVRKDG